jgi:Uma2 family endonuclease
VATSSALLSIEEYLHTSYHPDADFVDGEVEERHLGEFEHARLQFVLAASFARHEREWNVIGVIEQRIRVAAGRVRICDVCLLRGDAVREKVLSVPPLLCIEVLSPEDRLPRAEAVLADYLNMGVPNIWLLDPIRQTAYTYNGHGLHSISDNRITVPNTQIFLDLNEIFASLN